MNRMFPWIVRPYESEVQHRLALQQADRCDVLISMPECLEYVERRTSSGKPVFLYSERIFKRGLAWRLLPPKIARTRERYVKPLMADSAYLLCSGAYVSYDLSLFDIPEEKCLKWGYFPSVVTESDMSFRERDDEILWVGRMLNWKRPLHALEGMLPILLGGGCRATFIGEGPLRGKLEDTVRKAGLENCVSIIGSLPNSEVVTRMLHAKYFVASSSYREGWGAVVNEAMACGMCVCASSAMGSVPFLIRNGVNGCSFPFDEVSVLQDSLANLLSENDNAAAMSVEATMTMRDMWSAQCAAERLVCVATAVLSGNRSISWADGPCSVAHYMNPRNIL